MPMLQPTSGIPVVRDPRRRAWTISQLRVRNPWMHVEFDTSVMVFGNTSASEDNPDDGVYTTLYIGDINHVRPGERLAVNTSLRKFY